MIKSMVLTALCPSAVHDQAAFEVRVDDFAGRGVRAFEFWAPPKELPKRMAFLRARNHASVYLVAGFQKQNGYHLCEVAGPARKQALDAVMACVDAAGQCGVGSVLLTSGQPGADAGQALAALEESLTILCSHAGARYPGMQITLEPGDTSVDARQLVGGTDMAVALLGRLADKGVRLGLTMDTSHLMQLGEAPLPALAAAKKYCDHIHLANCILDPASPLYGDKHPLFSCEGGALFLEALQDIFHWIEREYEPGACTVGLEIINRDGDEDAFVATALKDTPWFYST